MCLLLQLELFFRSSVSLAQYVMENSSLTVQIGVKRI